MKNGTTLLLILVIFLSSISQLYGEDEVFPKSDAIWAIHVYNFPYDKLYVYGLRGDTIINDKEYQKLYFLNDTTFSADGKDIYVAGIRQESKKVWIQPNGFKSYQEKEPWSEYLLYDFSKKIGEEILFRPKLCNSGHYPCSPSFEEYCFYERETVFKIEDIEETMYGKKFSFSEEDYIESSPWIEGVGSLAGLWLPRVDYSSYGPAGCFLRCMKVGDQIKYLDEYVRDWSDCSACFGNYYDPQSVEEQLHDSNLKISFHPETKILEVISEVELTDSSLDIVNIEGKILRTVLLKEEYYKIDLSNLNQGTYIYKLQKRNLSKIGKIIVW